VPRLYGPYDEGYSYDALNRLTAVDRSGSGYQSFTLDALGNMNSVTTGGLTQDRTSNMQNQVITMGAATLTYDHNGNTTTDDQGHTLTYDAWNRLVSDSWSGHSEIYQYDGTGRRSVETVTISGPGTTTDLYYSSSWQVLEERQGGDVTVQNVYSPVYVNAILFRDTFVGGTFSQRLYATQDANYNVTGLLNTSGIVQEHFVYDSYGKHVVTDGTWTVQSGDTLNWTKTFQGGEENAATGLVNFNNRDYNLRTFTWNTADPLGYVDGLSRYPFVADNPINRVDPNGTLKFVPNMGHLWGRLGPGDRLSRAQFFLWFKTDKDAFKAMGTCEEINFIQIYRMHTEHSWVKKQINHMFDGLYEDQWTVDDKGSNDPPYYNNAEDAFDPRTHDLNMIDTPGTDAYGPLLATTSFDFETAVVASKGPDKGDVYADIKWGFNFWVDGPMWGVNVHPKYYVNNVVWSPDSPVTNVQQTISWTGQPVFKSNGAPVMEQLGGLSGAKIYKFAFPQNASTQPSVEMSRILDRSFAS
jgi:RHS repeat-associated protein